MEVDHERVFGKNFFSSLLFGSLPLLILLWIFASTSRAQVTPGEYHARIYRDAIGIGHVYGNSDEDVAYGVGRLVARDKPLKTLWVLTSAAGRLAEVLGRDEGEYQDFWIKRDRMVRAYRIPETAQALWNRYVASSEPDEIKIRKMIVAYVEGIKDGIRSFGPGGQELAVEYAALKSNPAWPYGNDFRWTEAQYYRLFQRGDRDCEHLMIQYWEPMAALLFNLGEICRALNGYQRPQAMDGTEPYSQVFSMGSSSWGITPDGNQEGNGYLQADSHSGFNVGHTIRFRSRFGDLDAGGVTWEGLGPFLFNGAFTRNVAWATMDFNMDPSDVYHFEARYSTSLSRYEYYDPCEEQQDKWKELVPTSLDIPYYDYDATPPTLKTLTKTVYHLDSPAWAGSGDLWAAFPDNDSWTPGSPPAKISVHRTGTLEPGIVELGQLKDKRVDPARTLYEMLTARTADDLLTDALGNYPMIYHMSLLIGSGVETTLDDAQLISTPVGRIPFRYKEYPILDPSYAPIYYSPDGIDLTVVDDAVWIDGEDEPPQINYLFHPLNHFPAARAYSPPRTTIKFMANCNVSPQWLFGRNSPFPVPDKFEISDAVVEPRYEMKIASLPAYQTLPLFTINEAPWIEFLKWMFFVPAEGGYSPLITASFADKYVNQAFGTNTDRQSWVIRNLENLYEGTNPPLPRKVSEEDMKALIIDRRDCCAYYLQRIDCDDSPTVTRNWFQDAKDYLDTLTQYTIETRTALKALMQEFDDWSGTTEADLATPDPQYARTPLKWHLFWHFFKEHADSPLHKLKNTFPYLDDWVYAKPYVWYWPGPSTTIQEFYHDQKNVIQEAVHFAAVGTYWADAGIVSGYRLEDLLYVRVPYSGREFSLVGSARTLRLLAMSDEWDGGAALKSATPRRRVGFGGRLPLLVRFRKDAQRGRKVWLLNAGVTSDLLNLLPEWEGAEGLARFEGSYRKNAACELYELPLEESDLQLQGAWSIDVSNMDPRFRKTRQE